MEAAPQSFLPQVHAGTDIRHGRNFLGRSSIDKPNWLPKIAFILPNSGINIFKQHLSQNETPNYVYLCTYRPTVPACCLYATDSQH